MGQNSPQLDQKLQVLFLLLLLLLLLLMLLLLLQMACTISHIRRSLCRTS